MWANWVSTRLALLVQWLARVPLLRDLLPHPSTRSTPAQLEILRALVHGAHLKSHRTVDGDKVYSLHRADGTVQTTVAMHDVAMLRAQGLLVGNMKFPAATYLLTQAGWQLAVTHSATHAASHSATDAATHTTDADAAASPLHPLTPR
ncbi:MAG: hypothetical protein WDZ49_09870 [Litorilinea sp.]